MSTISWIEEATRSRVQLTALDGRRQGRSSPGPIYVPSCHLERLYFLPTFLRVLRRKPPRTRRPEPPRIRSSDAARYQAPESTSLRLGPIAKDALRRYARYFSNFDYKPFQYSQSAACWVYGKSCDWDQAGQGPEGVLQVGLGDALHTEQLPLRYLLPRSLVRL